MTFKPEPGSTLQVLDEKGNVLLEGVVVESEPGSLPDRLRRYLMAANAPHIEPRKLDQCRDCGAPIVPPAQLFCIPCVIKRRNSLED